MQTVLLIEQFKDERTKYLEKLENVVISKMREKTDFFFDRLQALEKILLAQIFYAKSIDADHVAIMTTLLVCETLRLGHRRGAEYVAQLRNDTKEYLEFIVQDETMSKIVPPSIKHAWDIIYERPDMEASEWAMRYITNSRAQHNENQAWTGMSGCGFSIREVGPSKYIC